MIRVLLARQALSQMDVPMRQAYTMALVAPEERAAPHAQFPVCRGDLDHVLGIVSVKDVWAQVVHGEPPDVTVGLRPPVYVPESLPAFKALEAFKASGMHAALVLDEYGGTEGLVTLIDVLEAIVGDHPEPGQAGAGTIVRRADGSWLVDGLTPVDEVTDLLGIDLEAEAEREEYQTMGDLSRHTWAASPPPATRSRGMDSGWRWSTWMDSAWTRS